MAVAVRVGGAGVGVIVGIGLSVGVALAVGTSTARLPCSSSLSTETRGAPPEVGGAPVCFSEVLSLLTGVVPLQDDRQDIVQHVDVSVRPGAVPGV